MKKFRNQANWKKEDFIGEVNNEPSETIPDQTMSVREIIASMVRGKPVPKINYPQALVHEGVDLHVDIANLQNMEIQDQIEYAKELKRYGAKLEKEIRKDQEEHRKQVAKGEHPEQQPPEPEEPAKP